MGLARYVQITCPTNDTSRPILPAQILPLVIPLVYFLLLPRTSSFAHTSLPPEALPDSVVGAEYTALPTSEDEQDPADAREESGVMEPSNIALSMEDKWRLVKPLIGQYMMPLCKWIRVALPSRFPDPL